MKNVLYGLGILVLFASCKKEKSSVDYAIISGKIINSGDGVLILIGMDKTYTIEVSDEGVFKDTIGAKLGKYVLKDGNNHTSIYLQAGNDIRVNYDSKDYDKTITILGNGSETSNYLFKKQKAKKKLYGNHYKEFYGLEEIDFINRALRINLVLDSILDADKKLSDVFKGKEKNDNRYDYLASLSNYESIHSKVSEDFLSELDNFDYSNDDDYIIHWGYKGLVDNFYDKKASELSIKDSITYKSAYLRIIKVIPNEVIKNGLLYDYAKVEMTENKDLDLIYSDFLASSTNNDHMEEITKTYNKLMTFAKGQPSPKFTDYENHSGGITALDDLKGKYVYIDVWATWCGPCIAEIPSLKKIEKAYHNKNIEFVSLSIDVKKDYDKWKNMVTEKELGGIQLLADNAYQSKFVQEYQIMGIPRFILIDPQGNIVTANAPRPSDKKLVTLFDELNI